MKIEVKEKNNERLDTFLAKETTYSRSKIQKLLKDEIILVNEKSETANYRLKGNDIITILDFEEESMDVLPEDIPIDIVYEDDYLVIINKKSGMVVHPAIGNYHHTLVNALLYHFNELSNKDTIRPGIVHRLDKDTSGLMVVAKTNEAHELLSKMIENKKIERKYLALVWGIVRHEKGTIDAPIGRDINDTQRYIVTDMKSKPSITHFKVIERYKNTTLIECVLETGRTHQIRVHMNYIGHPIVNDPVYGNRKIINDFGQMLHSKSIRFIHPITQKEIFFEVDPPKEFAEILNIYRD